MVTRSTGRKAGVLNGEEDERLPFFPYLGGEKMWGTFVSVRHSNV